MKILNLAFLILFSSGGVLASDLVDCRSESSYPLITKMELLERISKNSVFIVDVNSAESFKKVHIPGAIHFSSHEKQFESLLPAQKDALIVSYCGSEKCGAWMKAAQQACKLGYRNVRHFKPGIQGWVASREKGQS